MFYSDNPVADYDRYCNEQQKELDKLPECSECGEKIQSDECYEFNDELICPDCLKEYHRKHTEDFTQH